MTTVHVSLTSRVLNHQYIYIYIYILYIYIYILLYNVNIAIGRVPSAVPH